MPAARSRGSWLATTGSRCTRPASAAPTGTAGIFVDDAGENSIVVAPGANAALDAEFVARCGDAFAGARVVLAQLETPARRRWKHSRAARAAGALAMLNPAPADAATSRATARRLRLLTPNETEFAALLARHLGERIAAGAVASTDDAPCTPCAAGCCRTAGWW
jgi:ribokinase